MESMIISDVQKNFSSIVQALSENQIDGVQINDQGKSVAVIISSEEYDRLKKRILDSEIDSIFAEFHDVNVALASK